MFQQIINIVMRRNFAWNCTFGEYFNYLHRYNDSLIGRIGDDPITQLYDHFKIKYPNEHATFLFWSKIVTAFNRVLINKTEKTFSSLLGAQKRPILDVPIRSITKQQAIDSILGTLIGYAFCSTVPKEFQIIRDLLLITIKRVQEYSPRIEKMVATLASESHSNYDIIISDHILDVFNHRKDPISSMTLILLIGRTAVDCRESLDRIISSDEEKFEEYLSK